MKAGVAKLAAAAPKVSASAASKVTAPLILKAGVFGKAKATSIIKAIFGGLAVPERPLSKVIFGRKFGARVDIAKASPGGMDVTDVSDDFRAFLRRSADA